MQPAEIPINRLKPATLRRLMEEYICREGTDYGHEELTLESKVSELLLQLQKGTAKLMFDPSTETCNILTDQAIT